MKGRRAARRQRMMATEMPGHDIRVGRTDGFRYIGVKPPIPFVLLESLTDTIEDQSRATLVIGYNIIAPHEARAHSQIGIMTSYDQVALGAVQLVAEQLGELGPVRVEEEVRNMNDGSELF